MTKIPDPVAINQRMIAGTQRTLDQLGEAQSRIVAMKANPDYDHPALQKQLDDMAAGMADKQIAARDEIAARQELDTALKANDKPGAAAARAKLAAVRTAHPRSYGKGGSISYCAPCTTKKLDAVKKVRRPQTPEQASDLITGVFEGREPDYCAVADSPTDAGKLSYGKHQASETSGNLYAMLDQYAKSPNADPAMKATMTTRLGQFSKDHNSYNGSAADRAAFKSELKQACKDPAMQATQDDYFNRNFRQTSLDRATSRCVSSPLGKAMFYDMGIQSGPTGNETMMRSAMTKLGHKADAKAQPCDPSGPTESEYLQSLNDSRRAYVTNVGGDAAKSTYREDFFDALLKDGNTSLTKDFVVKGVPVKGIPGG